MALFKTENISIPSNLLSDRYIVPPFSILNTITSVWQKRKDLWESLGIDSAEGRDVRRYNAMPVNTFSARGEQVKTPERTSTFDPVLCEILYKWFSKPESVILDPFAGGSVRGIVANALGRTYTGIDINPAQIESNYAQLDKFLNKYNSKGLTEWIEGDSYNIDALLRNRGQYDMLLTCPPYYNLEKYTNNPFDLSNSSTYSEFNHRLFTILARSYRHLKDNSFAVIVVGEIRDPKTGEYYGLVPDTINTMVSIGFKYYDEIILENNIGSLPIRGPKYFDQSRKIGKHHQNILVFYKGDTTKIERKFGKYEPETSCF